MKIKKIIVMLAVGFIAPLLTSCSENDNPVDPEEEVVHISGIDITATGLNEGEATLAVGSTLQLSADIYPPNATEVDVEWTSSDEDVVSVSKRGLVTALKAGDVTITVASVERPDIKATIIVHVVDAIVDVNKEPVDQSIAESRG